MTPSDFKCPRRIGYLFPHPCGRPSPLGCPDCQDGRLDDPYDQRTDRYAYIDYDDYGSYGDDDTGGEPEDFTEADGEYVVKPHEGFEDDLTES